MSKVVTNAKHPVAAFFHILFKVSAPCGDCRLTVLLHMVTNDVDWQTLALAMYLFGGLFIESYVFVFVVCILLLAFDFWTVKVGTEPTVTRSASA